MADLLEVRARTHGDYEVQAVLSQRIKDIMRSSPNWDSMPDTMCDGLEMIAVKISRMCCGDFSEIDHPKDVAGYASLILKSLQKSDAN